MPGLFGRLRLEDGEDTSADSIAPVLSEMAARMRHAGNEEVEQFAASRIGRRQSSAL